MTLSAALYTHLTTTNATLAALLSTRVYPLYAPETERPSMVYPFLAYRQTDEVSEEELSATTFWKTTWSLAIVDDDYDGAVAVKDAIRAQLHRFRGQLGGTAGVAVKQVRFVSAEDLSDPELLGLAIIGVTLEIVA
jgi:hypothetical protein